MERFELQNPDSFDLVHIFECGQCFRWNQNDDGSYTGVIKNAVINVKKENDKIIFKGTTLEESFENLIKYYFDLNTDYSLYKEKLSNVDDYLKESIEFGSGIRILKQDLWECIISFIISANNNIPRIKKIIERISKEYGTKIIYNDKEYYLFPTPEQLSKATVEDLRGLGLGFRDKRIYNTTKLILDKSIEFLSEPILRVLDIFEIIWYTLG